jgi:uncharacterized delta-60 repeat protein
MTRVGSSRVGFAVTTSLALVIAFGVPSALGAGGDLDPTFGGTGKVVTAFAGGSYANAVAIQADAKIVAVGSVAGHTAVARYLSDGSLDPAFGTDGLVTTQLSDKPGWDEARAVAIQSNGKIVVVGAASGRFGVVRYLSDGTLDPAFGGDGIVRTDLTNSGDGAEDLVIQPNGRIVVVGEAGLNPRFALVRYMPDGTRDPAFGDRGMVLTTFGGWASPRAVALQSDRRIVVAGAAGGLALARYLPNGTLDRSFGDNGKVSGWKVPSPGWAIFPSAMTIQPNGRILAAGGWDIFELGLARFLRDGRLDLSFGRGGFVRTHVACGEQAITDLVLQPDGRIIGAGNVGPHEAGDCGVPARFIVLRTLPDGSLDPTWGGNGKVVTHFPGGGGAWGAALQADGRLVLAGSSADGFALARYMTAATP